MQFLEERHYESRSPFASSMIGHSKDFFDGCCCRYDPGPLFCIRHCALRHLLVQQSCRHTNLKVCLVRASSAYLRQICIVSLVRRLASSGMIDTLRSDSALSSESSKKMPANGISSELRAHQMARMSEVPGRPRTKIHADLL